MWSSRPVKSATGLGRRGVVGGRRGEGEESSRLTTTSTFCVETGGAGCFSVSSSGVLGAGFLVSDPKSRLTGHVMNHQRPSQKARPVFSRNFFKPNDSAATVSKITRLTTSLNSSPSTFGLHCTAIRRSCFHFQRKVRAVR